MIGLALPFFAASPAEAQAARTWVSGAGDDANPCSRTAPCRSFGVAILNTAAGGEINCLDAGNFGPVAIQKAITISCEGGTAGVLVANSNGIGISIFAATTDVVTLRGLDIDGQGSGGVGISVERAKTVHIDKCSIRNFRFNPAAAGLLTVDGPTPSTYFVFIADTVISDNSNGALFFSSGGFKVVSLKNVTITGSGDSGLKLNDSNVYVNVTKSVISGNGGSAVLASASGTTANVDRTTIANNGSGLEALNGATIRVSGNNIYNNTFGFIIPSGGTIQSDNSNNTGGSNGGVQAPNATLAKN